MPITVAKPSALPPENACYVLFDENYQKHFSVFLALVFAGDECPLLGDHGVETPEFGHRSWEPQQELQRLHQRMIFLTRDMASMGRQEHSSNQHPPLQQVRPTLAMPLVKNFIR